MIKHNLLKYNLQFFADEPESDEDDTNDNTGDNGEVDLKAFADIISDKDKQIQQLEKDVAELKKSNANLLVKVSAGATPTQTKTFDENLLDLVGAKPRKE